MELELRHLRALCAISDAGSVHGAARWLGVSQPALTAQLNRIERAVGGRLFVRDRSGCRPTPLGRSVTARARPLIAEMSTLVSEAREEARALESGPRLRLGSTANRAVAGWLCRLHGRFPDTDVSIRVDPSPNSLLRMVADGQLDVAFVHEVTGCPLRVPDGVGQRTLLWREPQFVALPSAHPAAEGEEVALADLCGHPWVVDPHVDGEWHGIRRMFASAGLELRVIQGDYLTGADLVRAGVAVTPCQPTSTPRPGMVIRPLRGDPLTVRLLLAARAASTTDGEFHAVYTALEDAYREAARSTETYLRWLHRNDNPLLLT